LIVGRHAQSYLASSNPLSMQLCSNPRLFPNRVKGDLRLLMIWYAWVCVMDICRVGCNQFESPSLHNTEILVTVQDRSNLMKVDGYVAHCNKFGYGY
jgi:hypothetical protein